MLFDPLGRIRKPLYFVPCSQGMLKPKAGFFEVAALKAPLWKTEHYQLICGNAVDLKSYPASPSYLETMKGSSSHFWGIEHEALEENHLGKFGLASPGFFCWISIGLSESNLSASDEHQQLVLI